MNRGAYFASQLLFVLKKTVTVTMMGNLLRSITNKHVYFEKILFDNIWINCAALAKISSTFLSFFVEVIKEKGLEHVTVEDLMVEITPKGRGNLT